MKRVVKKGISVADAEKEKSGVIMNIITLKDKFNTLGKTIATKMLAVSNYLTIKTKTRPNTAIMKQNIVDVLSDIVVDFDGTKQFAGLTIVADEAVEENMICVYNNENKECAYTIKIDVV